MNFENYINQLISLKTKKEKKNFIETTDNKILSELFDNIEKKYYENKIYMEDIDYDEFINLLQKKLEIPLIKLNRVYTHTELLKKLEKFNNNKICITPKLDGISVNLIKNNEDDYQLLLKGKTNQTNITKLLPFLITKFDKINKLIKNNNLNKIIMKGELIKPINKLLTKNGRSEVNGIIKRKTIVLNDLKDVQIIFYELNCYTKKEKITIDQDEQFKLLLNMNLNITEYKVITKQQFNFDKFYNLFKNYKYETDGFVIKDTINSIAFKYTSELYKVTITNIKWIKNKFKYTPILYFDQITIDNVNVKKVTGSNAKKLITNKIGIGSIIEIAYKGSTTTVIVNVIKQSENYNFPEKYKYDEKHINIIPCDINLFSIQDFVNFFKLFSISNFSNIRITKLVNIIEKNNIEDEKKNTIIFWITHFIYLLTNYNIFGEKLDNMLLTSLTTIKNIQIPCIDFLAWLPTTNKNNISLEIFKKLINDISIKDLISLKKEEKIIEILSNKKINNNKILIIKDKILLFNKMKYIKWFNFTF